ncbi:MAG: hypothetical protein ACYDG4_10685 [Desulfuromonadaceae bacterium]
MNPGTGHLVGCFGSIPGEKRKDYETIPPELERAAAVKLAGKEETMVSLTSGGKLSRWAAGKRNERKARNRMAKESQRRNRG